MWYPPGKIARSAWQAQLEDAWRRRSVVWLSGVRRSGKTMLCRSLPDVEYLDCELPRVRRRLEDPEAFLDSVRGARVVLDEVHRLAQPSELLKIAADHYPDIRILATGSSTLGASARFSDTLTGRKAELWLTPMTLSDMLEFGATDLDRRLLRGGLPPFFLAEAYPEREFQEWMDAYWAKDIQELFRLERRHSFQRFAELLMAQSGGMFEASRFARPCEVSRTTISTYLSVLEATYVVHVLRPFSSNPQSEIVSAPKIYGFDTGFVCYHRGWASLRQEDRGLLWEHIVLNELQARLQQRSFQYWRDKRGHEVDFVLPQRGGPPIAIECKWSSHNVELSGLRAFRRRYPDGPSYLVCADLAAPYTRKHGEAAVRYIGLAELAEVLSSARL